MLDKGERPTRIDDVDCEDTGHKYFLREFGDEATAMLLKSLRGD